jgi:hypothetical protein
MSRDDFQVTAWSHPHEQMTTQWGKVSARHWIMLEIQRWKEKSFREAWCEENSEGLVAMFCHREDLVEVDPED